MGIQVPLLEDRIDLATHDRTPCSHYGECLTTMSRFHLAPKLQAGMESEGGVDSLRARVAHGDGAAGNFAPVSSLSRKRSSGSRSCEGRIRLALANKDNTKDGASWHAKRNQLA